MTTLIPKNNNVWTSGVIDLLHDLWNVQGLSAETCAMMINARAGRTIVTRNSVLGKVHRLKFTLRGKMVPSPRVPRPPRKKKLQPSPPAVIAGQPEQVQGGTRVMPSMPSPKAPAARLRALPPVKAPPPQKPPEPGTPVTIMDLTGCKWPISYTVDGRHTFCNAEKDNDLPYCPYHAAQAVQAGTSLREIGQQRVKMRPAQLREFA